MREDFLHYLWRLKRFDLNDLKTTAGEPLQIKDFGRYNTHAGADFEAARLVIGTTEWAGNVEMHLRSSDWLKHGHGKSYDNVILHVVLDDDVTVQRTDGSPIPTLALRKRVPQKLHEQYLALWHSEDWIPCEKQFLHAAESTRQLWLDRLLVERLEDKTTFFADILKRNGNSWEQSFYEALARNFGVKVNAEPFERLARALPLLTLGKHKSSLFQTEALLFGVAGFLEDLEEADDYRKALAKEFGFLKHKYQLTPLPLIAWKFLRLRPANFPTLRLAQFALLIHQSVHLFSKILEAPDVKALSSLFSIKITEGYWLTHYSFGTEHQAKAKSLGEDTVDLLLINTIIPFLFLYGKQKADEHYTDKALALLEEIAPEHNQIIATWQVLGARTASAYDTQALLQLKNCYCDKKRCLDCAIGNAILK